MQPFTTVQEVYSCSVKLQFGPSETTLNTDNSQCLLLNVLVNATRDIFQFVRWNKNTKNENAGIKRNKIWGKSKRKGCVLLLI